MHVNHFQMYTGVKIEVARLRRDARSGKKEFAAEFVRYLRNARLIEVLSEHQFPDGYLVNVPLLSWEISQLEAETKADGPVDNASDLTSIRNSLEIIAGAILKMSIHKDSHAN